MPEISVIIPVYNRYETIKDAIESTLLQTFQDRELIVIDDGSLPEISTAIKPYMSLIKYIRNSINKGVSAARNTGIAAAKGEYVAFLDSDDIFLPDKLAVQLDSMKQQNLKISHTDELWYKNGKWRNQGPKHTRYGGDIFMHVLDKCRVSPSSLMVHKSVFEDVGKFDETRRVCEDYEWTLRAATKYKFDYIKRNFLIKRSISNDQLSVSIKHIESVRLDILKQFAGAHNLEDERADALRRELERKMRIVKY